MGATLVKINAQRIAEAGEIIKNKMQFEPAKSALSKWVPNIKAAADDADGVVIDIYDQIGFDWWSGEGITAKLIAAILRRADGADVTVNINSPGGDFFEGVSIYNLLREYDGHVRVRIVGMAASAASVIALAGDTVEIAETAMFMIHNSWSCACGNKEVMSEVADLLGQLDEIMLDVYAGRSNTPRDQIVEMMKSETWLRAAQAIEHGFADEVFAKTSLVETGAQSRYNSSLREVDNAMAKAGISRSKRRDLIKSLTEGTPSAANPDKPGAVKTGEDAEKISAALRSLIQTLKN